MPVIVSHYPIFNFDQSKCKQPYNELSIIKWVFMQMEVDKVVDFGIV